MKKNHPPIDPRAAAGLTGAVDPGSIIEDEMGHEQPDLARQNPARWHQRVVRTVDRIIRSISR